MVNAPPSATRAELILNVFARQSGNLSSKSIIEGWDQQTATRIKSLLLNYNLKADLNILSFSHYEKALRSREFNLVNQVLPKHIILKNPALYWDLTLGGLKDGNRY